MTVHVALYKSPFECCSMKDSDCDEEFAHMFCLMMKPINLFMHNLGTVERVETNVGIIFYQVVLKQTK